MPQVFAFLLAGAGIAAMKWINKVLHEQAAEAVRRAGNASSVHTKDLGTLEYDADAKVYRPISR